jgi:hypothetical protein
MLQIENYRTGRQYDSDKSLATFDVRKGESLYIDIKLMVTKNGHKYLVYPSRKRVGHDGKEVYVRFYDWGKRRNEEFDKEIMEALKWMGQPASDKIF